MSLRYAVREEKLHSLCSVISIMKIQSRDAEYSIRMKYMEIRQN